MARRSSNDNEAIANVLRVLPAKWIIGLLVAVVLYFFLQPRLNQWFGWSLPSIAAMAGNEAPAKNPKVANNKTGSAASKSPAATKSTAEPKSPSETQPSAVSKSSSTASTANNVGTASKASTASPKQADEDYKYRILKPVGRDRYESPAGLIYAPGSEEGHRLAHIAKHLEDQPERPGSHGVFEGDMASFLVAIDDAYKRARGHAKGTKSRVEDGMTVYEAPFDQTIGYLGGTEGARKRNPKLKKMRLVIRDRNLITAFPIQ
ncbi:MAG: hypothetical protein EBU88_17625 [Acidobacteria bacterium]|jgi:hypothetical protein|nr:hypothetical protein [Acidobacteriota bacterium]